MTLRPASPPRLALRAAVALVLTATLAGCSAGSDDASSSADSGAVAADAGSEGSASDTDAITAFSGSAQDEKRSVITTGYATIVVDDPAAAAREVTSMVTSAGGWTEGRSQQSGSTDSRPSANLTVRVPADKVDDAVAALDKVGDVRDLTIDTEDVTASAQDLDARIAALTTSTQRLKELMEGARTTADLLAAEKELTERQGDLEKVESRRARLSDQVAMSTLTLDLVAADTPAEESGGFRGGLSTGWDALVATVGFVVVTVGVLLPWLVLAALVAGGIVWWRRRSAARAAGSTPDDGPDDPGHTPDGTPGPGGQGAALTGARS